MPGPQPVSRFPIPRARLPAPSSQVRLQSLPKRAAVPKLEREAEGASQDQAGPAAPKLTRRSASGETGQVRPRHGLQSRSLCSTQAQQGHRVCHRARVAAAAAATSKRRQPPPWVSALGPEWLTLTQPGHRVEGSPCVWAVLPQERDP